MHTPETQLGGSLEPVGSDTHPWFIWGERELTVWQRV
jgi:hypothetical protein